MLSSTKPSDEICGMTTRVMPVLIFSVAVFAVSAAPPVPVLMPVPVDGSLTRRIVKLWIVAGTLFMVTTRGRLTTLPLPASSRAVKRAARSLAPFGDPRGGQAGGGGVAAVRRPEGQIERGRRSGTKARAERRRDREVDDLRTADDEPAARMAKPPLHAEAARKVCRRFDDARLDEHLRARDVERADQRLGVTQPLGEVAHEERVRPLVERDAAPFGQHPLHLL